MKNTEISIAEVKRIVDLIKKVDCSKSALVTDTAKEMGIKKTALMQFIEDNSKLFSVGELWSRSPKGTQKLLGLAIDRVYLNAVENPDTEEWLEQKKAEWKNKIYVVDLTYYNQYEFSYIPEDDPNSTNKTQSKQGQYRNTPEKIKELADAGIISKQHMGYGGLGDYSDMYCYVFNDKVKEAVEKYGWTVA